MQKIGRGSRPAKYLPNARTLCGCVMPFPFKAAILMFFSLFFPRFLCVCLGSFRFSKPLKAPYLPLCASIPTAFFSVPDGPLPFSLLYQFLWPIDIPRLFAGPDAPSSLGSLAVVIGFACPTFPCWYVCFGAESFLMAASTLHCSVRPHAPFFRRRISPFNAYKGLR